MKRNRAWPFFPFTCPLRLRLAKLSHSHGLRPQLAWFADATSSDPCLHGLSQHPLSKQVSKQASREMAMPSGLPGNEFGPLRREWVPAPGPARVPGLPDHSAPTSHRAPGAALPAILLTLPPLAYLVVSLLRMCLKYSEVLSTWPRAQYMVGL